MEHGLWKSRESSWSKLSLGLLKGDQGLHGILANAALIVLPLGGGTEVLKFVQWFRGRTRGENA